MSTEWEVFEQNCKNCTACGLATTRRNVVVGRGNPNARVLFVGEGPGEQEDLQGLPFVGPAGQLLDLALEAAQLRAEEYYIANIVKCRPPQNRDPSAEEAKVCISHLRKQFSLIQPEVIVCLGRVAAKTLIDPNIRITKERGVWIERKNVRFLATFHPAAILHDREGGLQKKQEMLEDLLKIRRYLDGQENTTVTVI